MNIRLGWFPGKIKFLWCLRQRFMPAAPRKAAIRNKHIEVTFCFNILTFYRISAIVNGHYIKDNILWSIHGDLEKVLTKTEFKGILKVVLQFHRTYNVL